MNKEGCEKQPLYSFQKELTLHPRPATLGFLPGRPGAHMSRVGACQRWKSQFATPLRGFLCWTFALTALIALRVSVDITPKILHASRAAQSIRWKITGTALGLAIPAQSIVFAMAWWTVWRRKASARGWAIAASLIFVWLSCHILYVSAGSIWWQPALWGVVLPVLAIGIAGLIVFSPRNLTSLLTKETQGRPSLPGDGTSALLDKAIWILPVAGYFVVAQWWGQWADAQNLTTRSGPLVFSRISGRWSDRNFSARVGSCDRRYGPGTETSRLRRRPF
jgi:hypothetical protein